MGEQPHGYYERSNPSRLLNEIRKEREQSAETDPGRRMESALALSMELRKLKAAMEAATAPKLVESS